MIERQQEENTATECPHFVYFLDTRACDESQYGNKGSRLALMAQAGFNVPDAYLIGVQAFEGIVPRIDIASQPCGSSESSLVAELLSCESVSRGVIQTGALHDLISASQRCLDLLGPLAVRSSGLDEDSALYSGAGQHESILAVSTQDQLSDAIARVVCSQFSNNGTHRRPNFNPHPSSRMAVVLQQMVDATKSGVIFTRNPVTGSNEMIIEAGMGLATTIVDGTGVAERVIVDSRVHNITARTIRETMDTEQFDRTTNTIIRQRCQYHSGEILTDDELLLLVETARHVEDFFGHPVDIEWSFDADGLVLLQARPITTLTSGSKR